MIRITDNSHETYGRTCHSCGSVTPPANNVLKISAGELTTVTRLCDACLVKLKTRIENRIIAKTVQKVVDAKLKEQEQRITTNTTLNLGVVLNEPGFKQSL